MIKSLLDTEFTKEETDQIIRRLNEVEAMIPFLVGLSPKERRSIPKMGKLSLDFVQRSLMYAKEHSHLKPTFYDVEAHDRKMEALGQLQRIMVVIGPLCEKIKDTHMALGSEANLSARIFYNAVKGAAKAGVEGADTIVEDLAERYKKQYTKTPEDAPDKPSVSTEK